MSKKEINFASSGLDESKTIDFGAPDGFGAHLFRVQIPAARNESVVIVEDYGYRVIGAADGEEAIKKFMEEKEQVTMLILDVILPKKKGKEVYDEIKKVRPDIKVLFTGAYSSSIIDREGIMEEGLNFISKPLSPREFLRKVSEVLNT